MRQSGRNNVCKSLQIDSQVIYDDKIKRSIDKFLSSCHVNAKLCDVIGENSQI